MSSNRKRILADWSRKAAAPVPENADAKTMQKHLSVLKEKPALYHCVSRVVDKRKILGFAEKEKFVLYMREYEAFCQVRILTYCVMGNHFHILVEVPEPPEDRGKSWSDERFLEHLTTRYHDDEWLAIAARLRGYRKDGLHRKAEEYRDKFFVRMWDLSWFLRLLKQRFAQWYNYRGKPEPEKRDGYLWSDRFRSIIVESGRAARTMAAYIDLNPVRAGIVEDPAEYRWCGYGEAVAGGRLGELQEPGQRAGGHSPYEGVAGSGRVRGVRRNGVAIPPGPDAPIHRSHGDGWRRVRRRRAGGGSGRRRAAETEKYQERSRKNAGF